MKQTLADNRTTWKRLLQSEAGASLLEWLEQTFNPEVIFKPDNQYQTAFNLGRRDVVMALKDIKERKIGDGE